MFIDTSHQAQIDNIWNNLEEGVKKKHEQFEHTQAFSLLVTAIMESQLDDQAKTSEQVDNNISTYLTIDDSIIFYGNDYDKWQRIIPNGYRG